MNRTSISLIAASLASTSLALQLTEVDSLLAKGQNLAQTECDSCGGCNSGCGQSSCDDHMHEPHVNLPKDVYVDPAVAKEAHEIVDAAEPIVLDLVLDLGLDPNNAGEISRDILLPAYEAAIADLIEEYPELADQMPELPTTLETNVNAVL